MIIPVWNSGGLGQVGNFLCRWSQPPTRRISDHRQNVTLEKIDPCIDAGFMLASQRGLRLGGLLGAQRRVRRCPSLGDLTPAGAKNSQGKLHASQSDRPTMTALRRLENTPASALLPPSESNVLRIKIKSKINCGEEL